TGSAAACVSSVVARSIFCCSIVPLRSPAKCGKPRYRIVGIIPRTGEPVIRPYAISFLFWSIASAGTIAVRSVSELIALRMILGVGEAAVAPASYKWIRAHFDEKERGLAVGVYMAGTKIGPAIGPPLAAWLILRYDWRLMFVVLGLGGLVWLVPWLLLVKDDRAPVAARPDNARSDRPTPAQIPFGKLLATPV